MTYEQVLQKFDNAMIELLSSTNTYINVEFESVIVHELLSTLEYELSKKYRKTVYISYNLDTPVLGHYYLVIKPDSLYQKIINSIKRIFT